MLNDDDRHIPVKLYTGSKQRFAKGGLATAAKAVEGAGRFGDEMVVHINRREFEELRQKWGEPHVNPDTGLPEFWDLKDLWNDVKDYVAPVAGIAAGALAPGLGSALGTALPGVANLLGTTGTQALASGLLGAGVGALTNGGKGALYGGLGGIAGSYGGDLLKNGTSSALGSAASGFVSGDQLASAAADNIFGEGSGVSTGGGGLNKNAVGPALLMAALNLGGSALDGGDKAQKVAKGDFKDDKDQFNKPLPTYENKRRRNYYTDVPDYTQQGEREYFSNNGFAEGGPVKDEERLTDWTQDTNQTGHIDATGMYGMSPLSWLGYLLGAQKEWPEVNQEGKGDREGYEGGGYVENHTGDHGRSDKIDALLSPNEYVFDAETVALLGNGSPEAGAAQLDRLRENIRAHKGSALAAGAISPDALPAEAYME